MEQRTKVLVVEDDAAIRQSLFETLGALGFAVGEANTGEDALQRLRMVDYDAVLLDIGLPGMHGWEVGRFLRQQNDKKTLSHRPLDRVRKANEPKGDRTCPELLRLKGVTSHGSGDCEVDHLIPLELGDSNSIKNLWPES